MANYTSLQHYWRCHLRWVWYHEGWQPIAEPEPLTVGRLVHQAIACHYTGVSWEPVLPDTNDVKEAKRLNQMVGRAKALSSRWIQERAARYRPLLVEGRVAWTVNGATAEGHPDLVAFGFEPPGCIHLVDFKTGTKTDIRAVVHTGQADYYAYLLLMAENLQVDFCTYEVINDDLMMTYQYVPNLERGAYLANEVLDLDTGPKSLDGPRFLWDCHFCPYFDPCWVKETGGDWKTMFETGTQYRRRGMKDEALGD